MFNKTFRYSFLFIFLAELFSLSAFLLPSFMPVVFFVISFLAIVITLYSLEYGLLILFAELFVGSKGYLFFLDIGGLNLSIRITLWLIVMAVWFSGFIIEFFKKKVNAQNENINKTFWPYFYILFVIIAWGFINGVFHHNSFNNIFFDLNGWLYFALIFPVYNVIFEKSESFNNILAVLVSSVIWLSLKTYFLLFIFSHNMIGMIEEVYSWVRVTGVGEITNLQGGFYRIFFQSHIYVLIVFFVFLFIFINKNKSKQFINNSFFLFTFLSLFLSVVILSFSRSNWVGLIAGICIIVFYLVINREWKKAIKTLVVIVGAMIISLSFIVATVKFPFPDPTGGFSTTELLSNRASQLTGEAALSSRWSLLPELWKKIKKAPVLGSGFGAVITYISSDPRVLEADPSGEFTTYAFEWGWLDIWIKLGILGIIVYIALIFKIFVIGIFDKSKKENNVLTALVIGLVVLTIVSFFSPYMNHPLGIGYLLLIAAMVDKRNLIKLAGR